MVMARVSARLVAVNVIALNVVDHAHANNVQAKIVARATDWLNAMARLAPADVDLDALVTSVNKRLCWPNAPEKIESDQKLIEFN